MQSHTLARYIDQPNTSLKTGTKSHLHLITINGTWEWKAPSWESVVIKPQRDVFQKCKCSSIHKTNQCNSLGKQNRGQWLHEL